MKRYKAIFFDLDHTLWDFKTNARLTLEEMFDLFDFKGMGFASCDHVITNYEQINEELWINFRNGLTDKASLRKERFDRLLGMAGIKNDELSVQLNAYYMRECPQKPHLTAGAEALLKHLSEQYPLHIISNGFRESQYIKLSRTGILPMFREIVLAEDVGYQKPQPEIFRAAVERAGVAREYAIYIGDHIETDVRGALDFGMDVVHFNPDRLQHAIKATYEVQRLEELMNIL